VTPEERALRIYQQDWDLWHKQQLLDFIAAQIREAVAEAERARAATQALITGDSIVLGGKLISNEEFYKQPTDYVKDAKAEAYEDAAKILESMIDSNTSEVLFTRLAVVMRDRSKEVCGWS